MTHEQIIKEIYEQNKDKLESESQIRIVLFRTFRLFKTWIRKGESFHFMNLFKVKPSFRTASIKHHKKELKRLMWNAMCAINMKTYRSWGEKKLEDDLHN